MDIIISLLILIAAIVLLIVSMRNGIHITITHKYVHEGNDCIPEEVTAKLDDTQQKLDEALRQMNGKLQNDVVAELNKIMYGEVIENEQK